MHDAPISMLEQFSQLEDPRVALTKRHKLTDVIAIDGKTLRRSHNRADGKSALHLVSAWSPANHLILGQRKPEDHSNEITAIPQSGGLASIRQGRRFFLTLE